MDQTSPPRPPNMAQDCPNLAQYCPKDNPSSPTIVPRLSFNCIDIAQDDQPIGHNKPLFTCCDHPTAYCSQHIAHNLARRNARYRLNKNLSAADPEESTDPTGSGVGTIKKDNVRCQRLGSGPAVRTEVFRSGFD